MITRGREINMLTGIPVLSPEERHQNDLKRLDDVMEVIQYQRDLLVEDPKQSLSPSTNIWISLLTSEIVPKIPTMGNTHLILHSFYPDLSKKDINFISLCIASKLKPFEGKLKNVELYNEPFVTSTADQTFSQVEVFNRIVYLRLTFK